MKTYYNKKIKNQMEINVHTEINKAFPLLFHPGKY